MSLPSFDEMVKMAKENPEELEKIRKNEIDKIINNAPVENQDGLRGLQNQLDLIRRSSKNKTVVAEKMFSEMMVSLNKLNDKLNGK